MPASRITINGIPLKISGRLLRIARPQEEWDTDIDDPEGTIEGLKSLGQRFDLFTFMQRLPSSQPKFPDYFREWDNVAAIPIKTFDHWFERQLHRNPRNKIKKALKQGLEVRQVPFDDTLIGAIKAIQDEVPIRQGRPYVHYGKSLAAVRSGYETYVDRAAFFGAYYQGQMVGFMKIVFCPTYARTMGILATQQHRDLAPMNALVAKAVEICAERQVPFLVYGRYSYGKIGGDTLTEFKFYNGFEHVLLPRYYVPCTTIGRLALTAGIHRGLIEMLPRRLVQAARWCKVQYFERRYSRHQAPVAAETKSESKTT